MRALSVFILLSVIPLLTHAVLREVPALYPTIQDGILAAQSGDTVLVAEGVYVENINFRGRNIVVASLFVLDGDINHIPATVIDGNQPVHEDSGSVVRIISGEDSTSALIGFVITGGTGTKFRDQSDNLFYVEGGGIIIENSNPRIAFNFITNNSATRRPTGTQSAGGGGIRFGYCAPLIENNVIMHNEGRYGGGVVSFFADGTLRNNVIANNDGGQDYGGGGVWIGGGGHETELVNNTIGGNTSVLIGGGVRLFAGVLNGHGNILWGNRSQSGGDQIVGASGNIHLDYCAVDGTTLSGEGHVYAYPEFLANNLTLAATSPCVDAGSNDAENNDPDNSRNDIGCYGGPGAHGFFDFGSPHVVLPTAPIEFGGDVVGAVFLIGNRGTSLLTIDSIVCGVCDDFWFQPTLPMAIGALGEEDVAMLYTSTEPFQDTLLIYHSDSSSTNPWLLPTFYDPSASPDIDNKPREFALFPAYPNPFNPLTVLTFQLPTIQSVSLAITDIQGRHVAELLDGQLAAGEHSVTWNAARHPSGMYFATLRAVDHQSTQKLLLLK